MKTPSDTNLVTAAQAGDKAAFVDLVARYQGMVTGITLSILRDFQSSEDAAQETFIMVWQKISEIHNRKKFRPWLAQIARNTALMTLRKNRSLPTIESFQGATEIPGPDELIVEKEEAQIVMNALDALPEKLRLPLILFYREDQSIRNVSETLSLTPDIIKKRLSKGRSLLKQRVTQLLDPVIRATGPTTLFTTAVAGTIGAMTSPNAMAAAAVSATSKNTTLAAVTTSKLSLATTVVALSLCIPSGYFLHQTFKSESPEASPLPTPFPISPSSRRHQFTPETSPLLAQWNSLKSRHLSNNSSNFPSLFQEITSIQDPLKREAFILLGMADWVKLDPESALAFFSKKDLFPNNSWIYKSRVISEWLRHDTPAALTAVEKHKLWTRDCSPTDYEFLSKGDPNLLTRAISLLPINYSTETPRSAALGEAARRDLTATMRAIDLHLPSNHRAHALSTIARFLSETNPTKARKWISELAPKDQTPDLTMSNLLGLAKYDPNIAFQKLEELKDSLSWHAKGAILKTLSKTHFTKALSWANQNPSPDLPAHETFQVYESTHAYLQSQFSSKLQQQGPAFLEELKKNNLLDQLDESIMDSGQFGSNYPKFFTETWSWLNAQESSQGIDTLKKQLLNSALEHNPQYAFQLIEELKTQPSYQELSSNLVQTFFSYFRSSEPEVFKQTFSNAPQIIFEKIATSPNLDLTGFNDLTFWHAQLEQLPAHIKPSLVGKIAAAITQHNPTEVAEWIATLPDLPSQRSALQSSYYERAQSHPEEADHSLATLKGHPDFDPAATGFLSGLAHFDPELAYSKLQNLGPTWSHYKTTADNILIPLAKHEPELASAWLAELALTDEHKKTLALKIEEQSKPPADPFAE